MTERVLPGSDWTPYFNPTVIPTPDRIAPYTLWDPKGDWSMSIEFYCLSLTAATKVPNTLVVFKKQGGADNIRNAVISYDGAGNLLFHPLVNEKAEDMDIELATDKAVLKLPHAIKAGYVHNITLRHENGMFSMDVDGVVSESTPSFAYDHVRHDMVLFGRFVNNDHELKGAVHGHIIEIEMQDEQNDKNSRLYHLVVYSATDTAPKFAPIFFVNHLNPMDFHSHLNFLDENSHAVVGSLWLQKVPTNIILISGRSEILHASTYIYSLTYGFDTPQDVTWNTNGTHLSNFRPYYELHGGKYYYKCSFTVESDKYFDTRIHLNAIIKNLGMVSKTIGDDRHPDMASVDPLPELWTNADSEIAAIPVGSVAGMADKTLNLDGFKDSNFAPDTRTKILFRVTSTDFPGIVTNYEQLEAAPVEVAYSDIISQERGESEFAVVAIEMDVEYADRSKHTNIIHRQLTFDKSGMFVTDVDFEEWNDDDIFDDSLLWDEFEISGPTEWSDVSIFEDSEFWNE